MNDPRTSDILKKKGGIHWGSSRSLLRARPKNEKARGEGAYAKKIRRHPALYLRLD